MVSHSTSSPLPYTPLHYFTALHCTALHCTAHHCTAMKCTTLLKIALHFSGLNSTVLLFISVHCSLPHSSSSSLKLWTSGLRRLHYSAIHCSALLYLLCFVLLFSELLNLREAISWQKKPRPKAKAPNVSSLVIVLLGHVCKQVKKINSLQVGLLALELFKPLCK